VGGAKTDQNLLAKAAGWLVGNWKGRGVWRFQDDAPMAGTMAVRWVAMGSFLEIAEAVRNTGGEIVHEDLLVLQALADGTLCAHHHMEGVITPFAVSSEGSTLSYRPASGEEGPSWSHRRTDEGVDLRLWFADPSGDPQITFSYLPD